MEFLTSWITNILLFIMLAVVVELLLPQTSLQKYVKLVLGLLLIVIILNPIFKLFSFDTDNLLRVASNGEMEQIFIENSIEDKKIEIQAQQRAYILEQTAVHLKEIVEKELGEEHQLTISNISIHLKDENIHLIDSLDDLLNNIKSIQVSVTELKDHQLVEEVKEVVIVVGEKKSEQHQPTETEKAVTRFLANNWGVDMEIVELTVERGQNR